MVKHILIFRFIFSCSEIVYFLLFRYETEFGFTIPNREIMADDIRVRAIGKSISPQEPDLPVHTETLPAPEEVTYITLLSLYSNCII